MSNNDKKVDRDTIELKTTNKHKVVLNTYLKRREGREIERMYLKNAKAQVKGKGMSINDFDLSTADADAENKMIEIMIVKLDGSDDNIVDRALDLNQVDFKDIMSKINELTGKKNEEK